MASNRKTAAPTSQQAAPIEEVNAELRQLVQNANKFLVMLLTLAENEQAERLLSRFLALADAMFIPSAGAGNTALTAALLGRCEKTVDRMVDRGELPATTIGNSRVIPYGQVDHKPA